MQALFAIYRFEVRLFDGVIDSPTVFDLSLRHFPSPHHLASANPVMRPTRKAPVSDRRIIELTIGPNPGLTEGQKKVIELDYGMQDGTTKLVVREALSQYLKKRLGLTANISGKESSPEEQHLILISEQNFLPPATESQQISSMQEAIPTK